MTKTEQQIETLQDLLGSMGPVSVAVSGGVDSLTLGMLAVRVLGPRAGIWHALSPAVPPAATERIRRIARQEAWEVQYIEAGEFKDENYLSNPYRRCFHCKSHLYATLTRQSGGTILSGANTDDLGDFRPGLEAARQHGVRHPYVECGIDKSTVRRIARHLGHEDVADLPASPCLSSRVETGLRIQAPILGFVDRVESLLSDALRPQVVRCRILRDSIAVQLDPANLDALTEPDRQYWGLRIRELADPLGLPETIHFEPYRMGSAFIDVA